MSGRWPRVRLGEVLRHRKVFITIDDLTVYRRPRVQLHAQGIVVRDEVLGAAIKTKKQQVCRAGEFLVAEIDAKVGGFGIVPSNLDGAIVSSHYFLFVPDETRLAVRFLDHCIRTRAFRDQVEAQGSTNYASIRPSDVLGYEIPLPWLDEQQAIVARIEELEARIAAAKLLRQENGMRTGALLPSVLNGIFGDPYRGIAGSLRNPDWRSLGDVVDDIADGPHVTPQYVEHGIPFITVLNITSGRIEFRNHKFITEEEHRQFQRRAKAERGDVLVSKDGTIGIPCYVDTDREFSFFVSVALIKPTRGILDGEFLTWVIRAPFLQDRIRERARGDMIRHLVLREIRDLPVPVPPMAEQRRIVRRLDALQSQVGSLIALQDQTSAELDALLPSILDRALTGEL